MVEATLTQENLGELHGRLSRCFARVEPLQQARKYITGLMSDLPRKNSWTLAEHAGDRTPDRMQRLLNDAVWDTTTAMGGDPPVRGRTPGPAGRRAGGRGAGRDRAGEEGQLDRGGETPVHGLRRSGRQRGEHRALLVCHPRWARPDRGPALPARRTTRRPRPPDRARHPHRRGVPDETPAGHRHHHRRPRRSDDAPVVRRRRGLRPLRPAAPTPAGPPDRLRAARGLRVHHRPQPGHPATRRHHRRHPPGRRPALADHDRSRLQGRAQLRLGLGGHHQPAALPAHPPPPPDRRASHIPDTGPNKVRSGMEVDHCENVVASSVRNSRTRP